MSSRLPQASLLSESPTEVNFLRSCLSHSDRGFPHRRFRTHRQHASHAFMVVLLCLFGSSVAKAGTCSITSFGAVGDGVTNNAGAIQNAFNYAAQNNCIALIPAGTFAYQGTLTANGIAVTGTGSGSILKALDTNNEALTLTGNGGSISNLVMLGTGTNRQVTYQAAMIWVNRATNFTVQNVLINGGSCVGIFDAGGQGGLIENNTVENTLADSITNTNGASNITVAGNRVLQSGDDGVSNNSYVGDPGTVNGITVEGNTILNNVWGRGLEVSGGSNITFIGNYVDNLDGYADLYIASESEWGTQSVSNVTVSGNTFVDGGPNQSSAIVYNSMAGANTIAGVTIIGNQFVNPKLAALQLAGNGSESGIVIQTNIDFSTGSFGFSNNGNASSTQTGNQVLAPSAYTTPLVAPGGGCSFSGCLGNE
jgi:Pectate lyase superfamily protein